MNITFLIGNGFDLNLGLKTSYSDFLQVYKEIKPTDSVVIKKFKQDILKDEKLWSNAEEQFGKYTEEFYNSNFTAEQYCECHEDFCENLAEYLKAEEEKIDFNSIPEKVLSDFLKSLKNYRNGFGSLIQNQIPQVIYGISDIEYNFINFNYTKTLDNLIDDLLALMLQKEYIQYYNIKYIHAHGLCDGTMVLGVNDKNQISNIQLFDGQPTEYLAQVMKSETHQITEVNNDEEMIRIIRKSDLIYIYGMSLGVTDLRWWEEIILYLFDNPNVKIIIHIHDSTTSGFFKTKQKILEKKVFTSFFNLFDKSELFANMFEEEKEFLKRRIYITNHNIFECIKDLSKKYTKNESNGTEKEEAV